MGKFGDKLRREREMRGVTLDEIAEATKIGTRSLRALEEERFEQLPGGIFNKGFVRSYARFLGLDEEQAVTDYVAAQGEQPAKADIMEKMAAQAEATRMSEAAALGGNSGNSNKLWLTLASIVLVGILVGGGWEYYRTHHLQKTLGPSQEDIPPPQVKNTPPAPANLTPTNAAPTTFTDQANADGSGTINHPITPAEGSKAPGSGANTSTLAINSPDKKPLDVNKKPLELQIHVARATWLSVQADGKEPTTETLRDSATKTIVAQDRIVITTGNAVEVTCNGTSLGILGADNKRSQLRITNDCKVN